MWKFSRVVHAELVNQAQWQNLVEVKQDFPSADQVQRLTVFNIGGNNYRLVVRIEYDKQRVYIRSIMTHADYDKDRQKMTPGTISPTYEELLFDFLPRPIKNEAEYEAVQQEVDRLIDKGDLSLDETDYLDLLGTLIMDYEERVENASVYELRGVELVKGLMELHELKQKDLVPIFRTKSIVSAVLNGKRKLTAEHINKLATFFHLPHALFFEPIGDCC